MSGCCWNLMAQIWCRVVALFCAKCRLLLYSVLTQTNDIGQRIMLVTVAKFWISLRILLFRINVCFILNNYISRKCGVNIANHKCSFGMSSVWELASYHSILVFHSRTLQPNFHSRILQPKFCQTFGIIMAIFTTRISVLHQHWTLSSAQASSFISNFKTRTRD